MVEPSKTGENGGRDPRTGRFMVGNPGGPGRPRGVDVRRIAEERATLEGLDLEDMVWRVLEALREKATEDRDVAAARAWLERIAGPVGHQVTFAQPPENAGYPKLPEGDDARAWWEGYEEIRKRWGPDE